MEKHIKIGALVQYKHGQMAGVVKYLVADPYSGQITQLVIDQGKDYTSSKLVDINKIADTTYNRQTVRLTVTQAQFSTLPDFIESSFVSAPSPFGGSSRPFYQWQGQGKIPLGTTYLYPLTVATFSLTAEETNIGPG